MAGAFIFVVWVIFSYQSLDAADQKSLVPDVRQAVKFAASDLKEGQLMPGFCLPKGKSDSDLGFMVLISSYYFYSFFLD